MPVFTWKGRNRFGEIITGERTAASPEELTLMLRREQISVLDIKRKREGLKIPLLKREKVRTRELAIYTRQLSVLIDADLPLIQGLDILAEQQKNKFFRRVITEIRSDVEAGSTLHEAKRKHPKVFDDLYCNMVASGEVAGNLDEILRRLAEYIERIARIKSRVKSALAYPITVLCGAVIIVTVILWKVIPVFAQLFEELGATLPLPTIIVIGLSKFISRYLIFVVIGFAILVYLFRRYYKTYRGRRVVDRNLLRILIFGDLLRKSAIARFSRTLSTLVSSGVPMLDSLEITSKTTGNAIIEDSVMHARQRVSEGKTLADSLNETKQFPPMVIQMISVGEHTGTLDSMLSKIADFYEEEVEVTISALMAMMEPVLILVLGGIIGFIIVSMYMPIFSLLQQLA
ncbi:type II secretion system F family protein [Candidatus Aminicenantes bacterium AC-708-M15]|jgi:type IV pilus assembly protein PilC|nr:type II secretion system F family protein [SCandidatus Aminicenantes bacterium Aminicenantia_JdfR_composite]MCP2596796.1 type II secretion system F family protein [Candidatus Aminicenantes bacterium AC-335-G13]MCP2598257.1 type II secretion system F family protein [Candidatus Aminicenantes bacterium AC-335-L06]MCP2603996.1 type II secretion system F family protein [Candidatus Aminicenantes bacterium AC-708-M15]MCP2618859.1 type II secretion system F family protein [Candidatus Aminicenantes b